MTTKTRGGKKVSAAPRLFDRAKLLRLKRDRGWSYLEMYAIYRDAANEIGAPVVTDVTLRNWASGKSEPSYTDTLVLCRLFGVRPEDFRKTAGK